MTLKTFNIDEKTYKAYSQYCKEQGISMSKKVENFIREELEKTKNSDKIKKDHKGHESEKDKEKNNSKDKSEISIETHSFSKYC